MLGSSVHHHRNMSFPHGGSVIHNNNMPPTVSKKIGGGRLNAVVNKLHLAKQCSTDSSFPEMVSEENRVSVIQNLLNPAPSEKKNLRAPPALFPLTSEVTIQRYPVIHPVHERPLDVFQRLKRLGTDIEMEEIKNETTLSLIPTSSPSQSTSVSCIPTNNFKTNPPTTSLIILPQTNVFNNRKIPEPSVVLEVKLAPKEKAQNIFFNSSKSDLKSYYVFSIDQSQISITTNGNKLYSCNVCTGIYQRRGALKKHYLKAHINYHYLTSRDLQIAGFKGERLEKTLDKWKYAEDHIGYYHCHKCCLSYITALELRNHVMSHSTTLQSHITKKLPDIVTKAYELCLYCDKTFENEEDRKSHLSKIHASKKRSHMCPYCQINFFDLFTLQKHMCTAHEELYFGCAECKERFTSRELAKSHKTVCLNNLCIKLESDNNVRNNTLLIEEPPKIEIIELKNDEPNKVNVKNEFPIEESVKHESKRKDESKKDGLQKEEVKKTVESKSYPFYCPDCKKGFTQQPNLARHMSLGHGKKLEYKKPKKLLQNINKVVLPKKCTKNQEKELKDEIQDLSAKGTQYVFLNNKNELVTKQGIPFDISYMNLEIQNRIRRMLPYLNPSSTPIEDDMSSLEVDAAASFGFPSYHDAERKKLEGFSGEWLYPRSYICSACPTTSSNIWDIFYHKWNAHPNVLCHHFDIPLDQLPSQKWRPERNLSRIGLLSECDELQTELPQCTKCGKLENDIAQLHRHILDCGGDTEWLKTMIHTTKSPNSKKTRKNWRPFNFRRRKNGGRARHGLKRTPPTPPLPVVKTKPGDAESVSRMIADLPPKRVTRRLVFEAPNGNNQATINSVPIDMNSRNPTVSSSTVFNKKIKKPLAPVVISESAVLISEAPEFLRSLNIMRAPRRPVEQALPCTKTETEEIIAAMKETLMASPAPTPIVLPKKRKRPTYDLKQLAEKIAKHDHNKILDPKIEETNDNSKETVPIPTVVKNKGKKLMSEIEVGLIKQNRLRRKRAIPSNIPEKVPIPTKKAKIEIQEKKSKNIVKSSATVMKSKNQTQTKKTTKVSAKKSINENFTSKIQTRNRKKNFIEESLSNEIPSLKKKESINNNESSSSFVDFESSQENASLAVPQKKAVKVNPFKPKARNRRKPGVFFGSRGRKRNLKTENKNQQTTSSKVDDAPLSKTIPKLEFSNSNAIISEQIEDIQNCDKEKKGNTKTESTVQKASSQDSQPFAQNELLEMRIKEENEVTAPIIANTTEHLKRHEVAEPRWHTQTDAFYEMPSTVSLGSILSSVNQILEGPDCNTTSSDVTDYSWTELQRAMGATDEEMAILHNFGANSSQNGQDVTNENRLNLLDLDTNSNQDTQVNSELNFKCKVCDQSYKGVAAFRIHSLDVHGIENPELVNVIKSEYLLICWVCKLVMEGGPEELDEHMARDHEFDDTPNNNSENGGKELKNKMVNKLGEILDQALKNLISSTQKPSTDKTWSGGAITLLGKLCALRNNEKSTVSSSIANSALAKDLRKVIGRNGNGSSAKAQPKRSQSAHAIRQTARLAALSEAAQRLTPILNSDDSSTIYKCPICNIGFETTSTRNKHISRAHNSPKKSNRIETAVQSCSNQQPPQPTAPEVPESSTTVHPMFSLGAINRKGLKKFNSTCSEEVRARAKQALRDLEIKSRLKHYTFSGDQPSPN